MLQPRPTDDDNTTASGASRAIERPAYQMFVLAVSVAAIGLMVIAATTRPDTESSKRNGFGK